MEISIGRTENGFYIFLKDESGNKIKSRYNLSFSDFTTTLNHFRILLKNSSK
jgi:hypothetical protein